MCVGGYSASWLWPVWLFICHALYLHVHVHVSSIGSFLSLGGSGWSQPLPPLLNKFVDCISAMCYVHCVCMSVVHGKICSGSLVFNQVGVSRTEASSLRCDIYQLFVAYIQCMSVHTLTQAIVFCLLLADRALYIQPPFTHIHHTSIHVVAVKLFQVVAVMVYMNKRPCLSLSQHCESLLVSD